jgi:hypothetical protein
VIDARLSGVVVVVDKVGICGGDERGALLPARRDCVSVVSKYIGGIATG